MPRIWLAPPQPRGPPGGEKEDEDYEKYNLEGDGGESLKDIYDKTTLDYLKGDITVFQIRMGSWFFHRSGSVL